jgi:Flp pilus assembly protein TadD
MRKHCPLAFFLIIALALPAGAQSLRITLPKRSKPTPVQQLNRDGVKAVERHDYAKAKKLFYKAYLIDPNDPFTLNNLGYISELEGDIDRAQRYYGLSADITSDATVDKASADYVEGKPVSEVAGNAADKNLQVNQLNVKAMGLLMKDRAPEADLVLQQALKLDPRNAYTLNNMGFAKEKEGELQDALSYYSAAAALRSREPVVVTVNKDWRGKPISEIAASNAKKVRKQLEKVNEDVEVQVARLNLRGVSALNRNERDQARKHFQEAYKLDPNNAFALNNMGYLAELENDRESADFYYAKAKDAEHAGSKVGVATRKDAEGLPVGVVAQTSDQKVNAVMAAAVEAKRREAGQPALLRRGGEPADLPASDQPVTPNSEQPNAAPNGENAAPANENAAPANENAAPANEQPPEAAPAETQPANEPPAQPAGNAAPAQPAPPTNPQPNAQPNPNANTTPNIGPTLPSWQREPGTPDKPIGSGQEPSQSQPNSNAPNNAPNNSAPKTSAPKTSAPKTSAPDNQQTPNIGPTLPSWQRKPGTADQPETPPPSAPK